MRVRKAGKVNERVWCLGREESCIYLLRGDRESMLISGGTSYIIQDVLDQMSDFGLDIDKISKCLILHAHFDHIGVFPYFKRERPEIEILASSRGWEILNMPKAIATINESGFRVAERMGAADVVGRYDLDWSLDLDGGIVGEGDIIDLGGVSAHIMETPGHSSCSISAYVPSLNVLFPSDGGGIPYLDTILAAPNSNFTRYQESLERLKNLEVDILCADHYGYITGEEARGYIALSAETAAERRKEMEEVYKRTGELDKAAKELTDAFFKEYSDYIISPDIMQAVFRQSLRHVASVLDDD
jgi:glyoxylase-like metal-dependent hydrolase (beta-lactamase superfamily II)